MFTLLDEVETTASFEGSHIVAIFKKLEKYEKLKLALADIRDEVERLFSIEVDGVMYHYLGADCKFLAIVTGIDCASSEYARIWCKCKSSERCDTTVKWSASDPSSGARTVEENIELSQLPRSRKKYNVSH